MGDAGERRDRERDRDRDDHDLALETLSDEDLSRALTMAQLKARMQAEREAEAAAAEGGPAAEPPERARPRVRDDELLADPPRGDHHLGRLGGWEKGRRLRQILVIGFAIAFVIAGVFYWQYLRQARQERLHPLPEIEATIRPGTPREMTFSEGSFRASLGAEPPAVNVLHLPDRDIVLADGVDTAHFKVEVVEGKTLRIKVLSGAVREKLHPGAEPLLSE